MSRYKRLSSMYSLDFWLFIIVIAALTAAIRISIGDTASSETGGQDALLYVFAATVIISVFFIQVNKVWNASLLSRMAVKVSEKFSSTYSYVAQNSYQSSVLTLTALVFVFAVYTINAAILGRQTIVLMALLLTLAIMFASLCFSIVKGMSDSMRYALIGVGLAIPIIITFLADSINIGYAPNAYVWLTAAITFSMLLQNRKAAKLLFKLFACALFAGIFFEVRFKPDTDFSELISYVSNIFSTGFVIFAPLEFRTERSYENYFALEKINKELQETQTQLVQREQMVTLGQLIAGVAHEINTPIGAIKASADMLDSLNIDKVLRDMRRYSEDALQVLITVLSMCVRSTKNMRSTMDIRRGKAQVRDFMLSIDIENAKEICAVLAEMEICDIEKIENNMDIFRRSDILEILHSARSLKPYISSVQSINYATNGISKIIFALKSFSHMNTTGERQQFDIVKNIDNVLVLYHNQIKRGIEINKLYDEELPRVYGNVEELSQVWTNIIQNAIYAMNYVGRITITIRNLNNKKVSVSFADTGPGIPQDIINKLFDPFFTTKPLGEGSGLGLDICRKVIEKHNGSIDVESPPGQGATFTVILPVVEQKPSKAGAGEVEAL